MIERLLKWLFKVLNSYSFRNPTWTREDFGDVAIWHTWPVEGYWHECADAGNMHIGKLLKIEQDPMGGLMLYIGSTLVLWHTPWGLYPQPHVYYVCNRLICHGSVAWEAQAGPLVFMWYYSPPVNPNGLIHIWKFQVWWDWYWTTSVRHRFSHSLEKAIDGCQSQYQWFTWA